MHTEISELFARNSSWSSPLMMGIILVLLLLVFFFGSIIQVLSSKIEIMKAIKKGDLDDFLKAVKEAPKSTLDQAGEINEAAIFLAGKISAGSLPNIIDSYYYLKKSRNQDMSPVFKRAFLNKDLDYWAGVYLTYLVDLDWVKVQTLKDLLSEIYKDVDYENLSRAIYRELSRYEANMFHAGNRELGEALVKELKELRGVIKFSSH